MTEPSPSPALASPPELSHGLTAIETGSRATVAHRPSSRAISRTSLPTIASFSIRSMKRESERRLRPQRIDGDQLGFLIPSTLHGRREIGGGEALCAAGQQHPETNRGHSCRVGDDNADLGRHREVGTSSNWDATSSVHANAGFSSPFRLEAGRRDAVLVSGETICVQDQCRAGRCVDLCRFEREHRDLRAGVEAHLKQVAHAAARCTNAGCRSRREFTGGVPAGCGPARAAPAGTAACTGRRACAPRAPTPRNRSIRADRPCRGLSLRTTAARRRSRRAKAPRGTELPGPASSSSPTIWRTLPTSQILIAEGRQSRTAPRVGDQGAREARDATSPRP